MTNPVKGEVSLKLSDGQQLVLVLDMQAMVLAESAYGKPLKNVLQDAADGFVGAISALLYGGLRRRQPKITLDQATDLLASDMAAIEAALSEAVERAMSAQKDQGEGGDGPNPPGSTSGSSGAKLA